MLNKEQVKKLLENETRYDDFTILDEPVKFKELYANQDIDIVQLHSLYAFVIDGKTYVTGFCGVCSWQNNEIKSLDGDSYLDEMLVYGYNWFSNEEDETEKCLDILVYEW